MNKKALVITTESPFPPKNGITIPVYNYIRNLHGIVDVKLLILQEKGQETVQNRKNEFGVEVFYLNVSKFNSALTEILGKGACFELFPDETDLKRLLSVLDSDFDYIFCSPIGTIKIGKEIFKYNNNAKLISAISDCYTAVLWNTNDFNSIFSMFHSVISKFRSLFMSRLERNILSGSDRIFVQSDADKQWLIKRCKVTERNSISIVTNCVSERLFDVRVSFDNENKKEFLFVATFTSDYYRNKLVWFYKYVWKNIDRSQSLLVIRGKGLNGLGGVIQDILNDDSVKYIDQFESDICNVYSGSQFLIAPIFKSYGFINKVGEALASGLVVIGDDTAFNAISGVEHKKNCLIANNSEGFIKAIEECLYDLDLCRKISSNAQNLARSEFKWSDGKIFEEISKNEGDSHVFD